MNYAEATLTDLFTKLEILHRNFSHAWNLRKSALRDRNLARVLCELSKALLVQLLLQGLDLVDQPLLCSLLISQLVLHVAHFVAPRCCHWSLHRKGLATEPAC